MNLKKKQTILHLNFTDFAVAVERLFDAALQTRPLIIATASAVRAMVYDMSEEAYQDGVRKGMLLASAKRCCPKATVRLPDRVRCENVLAAVHRLLEGYSPRIEAPDSQGHFFVDLSGTDRLFGPVQDVGRKLARRIQDDLGLSPSWTSASSRLVAKAASRAVRPSGIRCIDPGQELDFLAALPLVFLPHLQAAEVEVLHELNIRRVGELLSFSANQLGLIFGTRTAKIQQILCGEDSERFSTSPYSADKLEFICAVSERGGCLEAVEGALCSLAMRAGSRLRRGHQWARKVDLELEFADGFRRAARVKLWPGTADDRQLFAHARQLLRKQWQRRVALQRIFLCVSESGPPLPKPQSLFAPSTNKDEKDQALFAALDRIRSLNGKDGQIVFGKALLHGGRARGSGRPAMH